MTFWTLNVPWPNMSAFSVPGICETYQNRYIPWPDPLLSWMALRRMCVYFLGLKSLRGTGLLHLCFTLLWHIPNRAPHAARCLSPFMFCILRTVSFTLCWERARCPDFSELWSIPLRGIHPVLRPQRDLLLILMHNEQSQKPVFAQVQAFSTF